LINKGVKLASLVLLIGLFAFCAWNLRDFGEPGEPGDLDVPLYNSAENRTENVNRTEMDTFVIENSQNGQSDDEDTEDGPSANNAVTAVVFDYRGFDTSGEATVRFAAVSGVLVTLRVALPAKKGGGK
jgi:hypothetical protein